MSVDMLTASLLILLIFVLFNKSAKCSDCTVPDVQYITNCCGYDKINNPDLIKRKALHESIKKTTQISE